MNKVSVLISYSHDSEEHRKQVLGLSERLREDGIEASLDQYVNGTPQQGWPRWIMDQLDAADSVLVVCTETYYRRFRGHEEAGKGKGADWEGALITQDIYDARSGTTKFVPVFLSAANEQVIPEPLRSATHYALTSDDVYKRLYDFLLGQAGVEPRVVGELKRKPRSGAQPLSFGDSTSTPGPSSLPTTLAALKVCSADISRIIKYAPVELIGRETETKLLSEAWNKAIGGGINRPHILTFVALGGEGKTSLVANWAIEQGRQGWLGCDTAFAWSFYSQGTREQMAASSDLFLADALAFFGDPTTAQSSQNSFDKGRRLAQLVGERRVLLILDGIEPLQYAPTSPTPGELKDAGLAALLKGLAGINRGLCVITTRYSIPDLRAYWQNTAPETTLMRLSKEAGVDLLQKLGVKGLQAEYELLVEDVKGHALTLNLLGSYLHEAHTGDIRKRDLVKLEDADTEEQGGHAFRVMDAYVEWFATGGRKAEENRKGQRAIALLQLLGLFDRPAAADCLDALLRAPAILNLTEPFSFLTEAQRNITFARLEAAKLLTVNRDAAGRLLSLDAHPLIREYFATRLRIQQPNAYRTAHRRIFEHLCITTKDQPKPTLEDLQPLYQAVVHGCRAELFQEACYKIYRDRIQRGHEGYPTKKLGALGSDLGAIACFFDTPWSHPSPVLTNLAQSWLQNEAGFRLRALGRLTEAIEPMRIATAQAVSRNDWENATAGAVNLSELKLAMGEVTEALQDSDQAMIHAHKSSDVFSQIGARAIHASALHQAGRRIEAKEHFEKAEAVQAQYRPRYSLLYGLQGYLYCDFLFTEVEDRAWQNMQMLDHGIHYAELQQHCISVFERATQLHRWTMEENLGLLPTALSHLTLGRACLYEAVLNSSNRGEVNTSPYCQSLKTSNEKENEILLSSAVAHVDAAVDSLRRAGQRDYLPRGLLTRAWIRSLTGAFTNVMAGEKSAQADLMEAWDIAERGPMPLLLADILLHRARLFVRCKPEGSAEKYPWESRAADLEFARQLIEKHGYLRRLKELEDAEAFTR